MPTQKGAWLACVLNQIKVGRYLLDLLHERRVVWGLALQVERAEQRGRALCAVVHVGTYALRINLEARAICIKLEDVTLFPHHYQHMWPGEGVWHIHCSRAGATCVARGVGGVLSAGFPAWEQGVTCLDQRGRRRRGSHVFWRVTRGGQETRQHPDCLTVEIPTRPQKVKDTCSNINKAKRETTFPLTT